MRARQNIVIGLQAVGLRSSQDISLDHAFVMTSSVQEQKSVSGGAVATNHFLLPYLICPFALWERQTEKECVPISEMFTLYSKNASISYSLNHLRSDLPFRHEKNCTQFSFRSPFKLDSRRFMQTSEIIKIAAWTFYNSRAERRLMR